MTWFIWCPLGAFSTQVPALLFSLSHPSPCFLFTTFSLWKRKHIFVPPVKPLLNRSPWRKQLNQRQGDPPFYLETSPRLWSEQVECTSPDPAPLRALGSHQGISNKTRWAAAAFSPKKLTEHKWGGRRPSPHALCLCHPAGFLCNNTLLFVEQQQDRTNRLSSYSSLPPTRLYLHPPPRLLTLLRQQERVRCSSSPKSLASASSRLGAFLHIQTQWRWGFCVARWQVSDSVNSQSKNCTLRQNDVYMWWLQWGLIQQVVYTVS